MSLHPELFTPPSTPTSRKRASHHARDRALVEATLQGRRDASAEFAERMLSVPRILAAQNRRLGSPLAQEELLDLVQDTLAVIWAKRAAFAGRAALETWAYRICLFELMNAVRKRSREQDQVEQMLVDARESDAASPQPDDARGDLVYSALRTLGDPDQDVIRLKHFESLTFQAIAGELEIPEGTVKSAYYRGLRHLRATLSAAEDKR